MTVDPDLTDEGVFPPKALFQTLERFPEKNNVLIIIITFIQAH